MVDHVTTPEIASYVYADKNLPVQPAVFKRQSPHPHHLQQLVSLLFNMMMDITSIFFIGVSPCASNPCLNGGSCYKYGNSFVCACTQYYAGLTCDTPKTTTPGPVTTPSSMLFCHQ